MSFNVTKASSPAMAGWVHILSVACAFLTSWCAGFGGMLPAFFVWLVQEDRKGLVAQNAAYAFNLNLSLFAYTVISIVFIVMTLGIGVLLALPFWLALALWWFIASLAAMREGFLGNVPRSAFIFKAL